ncbi:MAG TPA: hypothetical protein VMX54_16840 [Vicinamibacteria bacterium]|nr:hypothetical protein [Vicinamibacteria bacterium]
MPSVIRVLRGLGRRHLWFLLGLSLAATFVRWPSLDGWDDGFYVAQLTSAVGDRDLLLHDDLLALPSPLLNRLRMLTGIVGTGALANTFSIGPAFLHASYSWPLLLGARPSPLVLRATLACGALGLLVVTVLAMVSFCERMGASRGTARVASVLAVALGPLAIYGTRCTLDSHLPSAAAAALLCASFAAWLDTAAPRHALAAGLSAGLLAATRWQELVFVLALAPAAVACVMRGHGSRRERSLGAVLGVAGFGLVVSLQLLAWRIQFGSPLLIPQGGGYLHFADPALLPFLFSTYHGLLPWAPGFALGLAALLLVRPGVDLHHRLFVRGAQCLVPVALYLSACPSDWWGGASYGPRRLSALAPLVALGLAHALALLRRPLVRVAVVSALCAWAVFVTTAYLSDFDDLGVVLTRATSRWNPRPLAAYQGAHWIDHMPTWPRILRPGFTFSDRPRLPDRILGITAAVVIVAAVTATWSVVRRSRRAQRLVVSLGLAWSLSSVAWLARLPPNTAADAAWLRVVTAPDGCDAPLAVPSGMEDARHLVCAARAVRQQDENALRRHLASISRPEALGVSEDAVRAAVAQQASVQ